jgi:DNA repair photolyase
VLRDLETLREISRVYATVSFSITSAEDTLSKKVEPGAPPSSRRFEALHALAAAGIQAGVTMMPILPFLEDAEENIVRLVELARDAGASYILPAFGTTMRTGSREYYYAQLDRLFPGLRARYETAFGSRYECPAPNAARLDQIFRELCTRYGIATRIRPYRPAGAKQMKLL